MARPKKITEAKESEAVPMPEVPTETPRARRKKIAGADAKFDLFAHSSAMKKSAENKNGFKSLAEISSSYLPVKWPLFQYLIGTIGIPEHTIIELIGQENTGKSSLVMALMGNFMLHNIPCLYLNTEPKMLEPEWVARLVSPDPELGKRIIGAMERDDARTYDEMDLKVREWIQQKRVKEGIPKSVPLCIAIDSITKLLNPEEAEILVDSKEGAAALNKATGDISKKPGVTAKWLHTWTRGLKLLLEDWNVTLICVSGQNMNMNAGPSAMAPDGGASLNKTRTGGTALNQSAAIQITITRKGALKNAKSEQIGEIIRMRCVKNSYGPKRDVEYHLHNDKFDDVDGYVDQAIDMRETFCNILVKEGVCGLKCERKRYSSAALGIDSATYQTLYDRITANDDLMDKIGAQLKINGYENYEDSSSEST